jgi:hypothetical protein
MYIPDLTERYPEGFGGVDMYEPRDPEYEFWKAVEEADKQYEESKTTPCDYPDENGNHVCPYAETYTGYESEMCRVCCGLGVDE